MQYLCDEKNKTAQKLLKDIDALEKEMEEKKRFIVAMLEAQQEKEQELWKSFFKDMQAQGIISKKMKYDEASMFFDSETKQFFLEERDGEKDQMKRILSRLLK